MEPIFPEQTPRTRREIRRRRTRRMVVCALLIALGVVIMMVGSLIDVLDLCTAAVVALACVVVKIEYGRAYPWAVYAGTAILALLLTPQKGAALVYAAFGYYPILKAYIERLPRYGSAAVKCGVFVLCEVVMITLGDLIFGADELLTPLLYAALYAVGFVTLWLYDVLLTRLITRYLRQWRARVQKMF